MKEIPLIGPRASTITTVAHEVLALKTLRHRNIVHLHDAYYEETKIVLIFEYCHQDLRSFMNQYGYQGSGILDSATIRSFMKQLLSGVRFCHQHNFYHRDLKPSNLLIQYTDSKWILKIADFGFASSINLGEHRSFQVKVLLIKWQAQSILEHFNVYVLGDYLLVSSPRVVASLHNIFHPDRYLGNRLHICGDALRCTTFLRPGACRRTWSAEAYRKHSWFPK